MILCPMKNLLPYFKPTDLVELIGKLGGQNFANDFNGLAWFSGGRGLDKVKGRDAAHTHSRRHQANVTGRSCRSTSYFRVEGRSPGTHELGSCVTSEELPEGFHQSRIHATIDAYKERGREVLNVTPPESSRLDVWQLSHSSCSLAAAQDSNDTILMKSTFALVGPTAGGKTSFGTVFVIGRPTKDDPTLS